MALRRVWKQDWKGKEMSERVFIRRNGEVLPLEVKQDKTKAAGFGVELHAQRPDLYLQAKMREIASSDNRQSA